jgi:MFS family permease
MYGAEDRGKATAIAGLLPYIGPAAGPIIGGLAAQRLWWPWLFWILSIFDAVGMAAGFFIIRESYGPVLLQRKAAAAARLAADEPVQDNRQPWYGASAARAASSWRDFYRRFVPAVQTPVRLLLFRPVVPLVALSMALLFGTYTILLSAFAPMWLDPPYSQSPTTASLHYVAIAIGAFACAQAGGPLMDWLWRRQRDADAAADPAAAPTPEYRLPYMAAGFVVGVAGLLWYAWAADRAAHWALVDAGVLLFTLGDFAFSQGLFAYLIDEFPSRSSASANAASRIGTYTLGFAFPIFSPSLYDRLGYGWGNSLLAFLLAAIGGAVLLVLWKWGPKIRSLGRGDSGAQEQVSTV